MNFDDPRNFDYKPRTTGRAPRVDLPELTIEILQVILLWILIIGVLLVF